MALGLELKGQFSETSLLSTQLTEENFADFVTDLQAGSDGWRLTGNCSAQGANLQGQDLRGLNFAGANLVGALLKGANIEGCDLSDTKLAGINLEEVQFDNASLMQADLEGVTLPLRSRLSRLLVKKKK